MSETIGPYRLHQRLGEGGMADVWAGAHADRPDELVAVKIIRASNDLAAVRRFLDEARIGVTLAHPNIARVFDVGQDGSRVYLAMELLDGVTFSAFADRPLPLELVLGLSVQVLAGLAHAHAAGVVHRDLKPSNLFLSDLGEVKIIDFGIARTSAVDRTSTDSNTFRGTVPYSSPEQAQGTVVDARSDLFSFALVVHQLLTGRRVLGGSNDAAILSALLFEPLRPPSSVRPDVPYAVDDAVMSALERNRDQRVATARELSERLVAAAEVAPATPEQLSQWLRATVDLPERVRATITAPMLAEPAPKTVLAPAPARSRVALVVLAFVLALATGVGLGAVALQREVAPPVPAPIAKTEPAPAPQPPPEVPAPPPAAEPPEPPRPAPPVPVKMGWVTIEVRPGFGRLTIDGKMVGVSPLFRYRLAAGGHRVRARSEDGKTVERDFEVTPSQELKLLLQW